MKNKIIYIFIFITTLFIIVSTYAYIHYFNNDEEVVDNDSRLKVTFDNTSNVAIVNGKKGDEIIKSFTIKNTSGSVIYYDIIFSDLINNFKDEKDVVFSLKGSNNAAYIIKDYMPKNESIIASYVKLNKNEEHKYNLNINIENSDEVNKTLSTNVLVKVVSTKDIYDKGTLGNYIINNNTIIDINNKSTEDFEEGLYYTNNSANGKTVFYFKGSNELKNNVLIGNTCYRILRTTEDNGIRVIYNGNMNEGTCDGTNNIISESEFNTKSNYNAYVGFMYGTPNSASYIKEHENINSSKIKTILDSYYSSDLNSNSSLIQNSIYCNNRKTVLFTLSKVLYGTNGYKSDNTGYESMYRIINNNPSYKCNLENDSLKVDILSNPIGLITADEAYFSGIGDNTISNNYLLSSSDYWTMSPAYFNGVNAYNFVVKGNTLTQANVSEKYGVRPVITLKSDVKVKSGNGSMIRPYVIY